MFRWIIVKDDKSSISSRPYSNEPNYREKLCIGQFVVNEMYSYICLCVFPVLWNFEKKMYHNFRQYHFKLTAEEVIFSFPYILLGGQNFSGHAFLWQHSLRSIGKSPRHPLSGQEWSVPVPQRKPHSDQEDWYYSLSSRRQG